LGAYETTPDRLRAAVRGLTEAQLDAHVAGGGWTIRQTVVRALDTEVHYMDAIRRVLAEPGGELPAVDEPAWADALAPLTPLDDALDAFEAIRALAASMLRRLREEHWLHNGKHPVHGVRTVQQLVDGGAAEADRYIDHILSVRRTNTW
jgi:hypothetical protein